MSKHICFESIDCPFLQYVQKSKSWVCLRWSDDIPHVDLCIECKRIKQLNREAKILEEIRG